MNQEKAIQLCKEIETIAPDFGGHVALTGGCLYKDGERKDCDLLIYRIRQVDQIDTAGLFNALEKLGIFILDDFDWCVKAKYGPYDIDIFFPEREGECAGGHYPNE